MDAVELINVSKSYKSSQGAVLAIDRLNLSIAQGEFFSLLGPSGCGKTTTLRLIAGFELPSSGEVYINHCPMGRLPPYHRPVNTVFQNYALFPHLTIAQNIAFGLEMEKFPRTEIRNRVAEALSVVQLSGLEKRYPRQLSGGQQQRVALARALVKRPKVLLLDEPLGALDLKLRREMQLELKHIQQQVGITFIYVTHDQEEALTMSDRLAVMNNGKVLQVGTPVEIYENPTSLFVADFIGETNLLTGQVSERNEDSLIVLVEKLAIAVSSTEPLPVGQTVTLAIRPEKVRLHPDSHSVHRLEKPVPASDPATGQTNEGWLGTIEAAIYLGTDTRYCVRIAENSLISARQSNSQLLLHSYSLGDRVTVQIAPHSVRLLVDS